MAKGGYTIFDDGESSGTQWVKRQRKYGPANQIKYQADEKEERKKLKETLAAQKARNKKSPPKAKSEPKTNIDLHRKYGSMTGLKSAEDERHTYYRGPNR